MILTVPAALKRYEQLRLEMSAGSSTPERQAQLVSLLQRFSTEYLWPFRIVVSATEKGQKARLLIVQNHGGHGNDSLIWEFHGWHREKDAVRLTTTFRNLYYLGHVSQEEGGALDGGLSFALPNIRELMASSESD